MKTKLMIALFSTVLLGACQNLQMGMDTKDMKETTEMMSSMSGENLFEVLGFMVPNLSIWTSGHHTTF